MTKPGAASPAPPPPPPVATAPVRPTAKPFARSYFLKKDPKIKYPRAAAPGYAPGVMPRAYGMPVGIDVVPQTIVILELGGAHYPIDTQAFCSAAGIPQAQVTTHLLPGADSSSSDADGEVALDVQKAAEFWSYMTGTAAKIKVVWGPNSGQAFADIINWSVANVPDLGAISISWGQDETDWTSSDRASYDAAVKTCPVPVFAASGDNGSGDGQNVPTTDFPAASPYTVGCGGTSFPQGGQETVWNGGHGEGTGGGFSRLYSRPEYQPANSQGTGRMVPDVAGNADPNTGHLIYVNGQEGVIGGTSAVAPFWAGAFAVVNGARVKQGKTKLGAATLARIWANPKAFRDILNGSNGAYSAGPGPDPCTGLGVPTATLASVLVDDSTLPPSPPPPPPPSSGVTLQAAQAAATSAIEAYARHFPQWLRPSIQGTGPWVNSYLSTLWKAQQPNDMTPRFTMPDVSPILKYLETVLVQFGEAALTQVLQDILAGKVPVTK